MRPLSLIPLLFICGCTFDPSPEDPQVAPELFQIEQNSIPFHHDSGARGSRYIGEIVGSGAGLLDADGDGDLDLFLVNGSPAKLEPEEEAPRDQLFLQVDGTFVAAGPDSGIVGSEAGMGLAIGDIDNDGDPDIFVANDGPDQLYINDGKGRFDEQSLSRGITGDSFSSAAVLVDIEGDGDLDLFIGSYLDFDASTFVPCTRGDQEVYCAPSNFAAAPCLLLLNDGTGNFSDVSSSSGLMDYPAKALGIISIDIEPDGDPDLYVANDGEANFLLINQWKEQGRIFFLEEALLAGCAYGEGAKAEAGMGVDAADLDGDGDEEILVTNLEAQSNSCYRNDGNGMFMEISFANGLGPASLPHVGFGIQALDANLDGHLDIFVTNGHIIESIGEIRQGASHFAQPDQLFLGDGNGFKLTPYSAQVDPTVGRSLLRGDLDNDGDDDLIITRWNSNPQLLRSTAAGSAAVLGLRLEGSSNQSNRDAIGARITVSAGGRKWMREHRVQSSYLASHDPRLLFALPEGCTEGDVSVLWPDGKVETRRLEAGSYHHWIQGQESLISTEFSPPR